MSESGFIKLHRKLKKWEWYGDPYMVAVFFHCILEANWEDRNWRGTLIKRGQFVTGRAKLSAEIGISEQKLRTCLERLKTTNEITTKSTNRGTLVTVTKYDTYQHNEKVNNQQTTSESTDEQPTNNQPTTTKEEVKEIEEGKETPPPLSSSSGNATSSDSGDIATAKKEEEAMAKAKADKIAKYERIKTKVNSLRSDWSHPAAFDPNESHHMHANFPQLNSATDDDWSLLGRYLRAQHPKDRFIPFRRWQLLQNFGEILRDAIHWEKTSKKGRKHTTPKASKGSFMDGI